MQETTNPVYDYQPLQSYFEDIATPGQIAHHLDQLLFFLVYHQEKEGSQVFYEMYCDIFDFKLVLQRMQNP